MKEFIIVIEADNKRAHAAYTKGLADLDLIWPQLMAHAEAVDAPRNERIRQEKEARREEQEKLLQSFAAYEAELARWERSNSMFRGPMPTCPARMYPMVRIPSYEKDIQRRAYESIRAELKHMADVAGAAMGPYRMTEHQVRKMVAWEDGSQIEKLKRQMASGVPDEPCAT